MPGRGFPSGARPARRPAAPLTVYGRATSSNVQAVMWGIAELGLECERLDYGHAFGGTDTPEFRAMNPNGLVPVLRDGSLVMFESCAILRYLAGRYGSSPFWPEDPVARAPVDMWAEWGKATFARDFYVVVGQMIWTPAANRDPAVLDAALERVDAHLAVLEAQLGENPFVLGGDLTLADIVVGHLLYRYFTFDITRPDRRRLAAYYRRLCERPAYAEHVMVAYDALRIKGE
ncbi:MAG TPA: glutathione S-transferase family protein [Amaricoccus sp.]|uniref:glutathione S-transferase family protein n=1 Tax=Amaricoccus sp. TaxID=1872485 RepID=UPI002C655F28|nr:glutathione S-transferase family protein [Amaricoccus sp.]HMQ91867.1 glutathione S-transferase family protein [Amaricoccus sp.]HMR53410.1 glutathione S-transferase family protein [Amaricoccus sp.]HMR60559.1 glutathione S-transferase family protein [Amaricoccus sp.]HMU00393.1 glutathione S-transferase family protein [Amaricoccus sp.]